jgi:hypothetical protein
MVTRQFLQVVLDREAKGATAGGSDFGVFRSFRIRVGVPQYSSLKTTSCASGRCPEISKPLVVHHEGTD